MAQVDTFCASHGFICTFTILETGCYQTAASLNKTFIAPVVSILAI